MRIRVGSAEAGKFTVPLGPAPRLPGAFTSIGRAGNKLRRVRNCILGCRSARAAACARQDGNTEALGMSQTSPIARQLTPGAAESFPISMGAGAVPINK